MMSRLSDDEKRVFTDQISLLKNENERLTKYVEYSKGDKECMQNEIDVLQSRKFVYTSESGLWRMICMISGEPWMCYRHADGQWVTLKKIALLQDD